MQLWLLPGGVLVTEVRSYPRKRAVQIVAAGTSLSPDWPAVVRTIKEYGRSVGCDLLEIGGRVGWARAVGAEMRVCGVSLEAEL